MQQDPELEFRVRKTSEKIAENIHIVANDPSLAFFRVQEHVRKVVVPILDKRNAAEQLQSNLQGHCYDLEYAVSAVKELKQSEPIFQNMHELIKNAVFLKQQLKFEESKIKKNENLRSSVYKRFSTHLTMDFPDFRDLSGVVMQHSSAAASTNTSRVDSSAQQVPSNNRGVKEPLQQQQHLQMTRQQSIGELHRSHTTLH